MISRSPSVTCVLVWYWCWCLQIQVKCFFYKFCILAIFNMLLIYLDSLVPRANWQSFNYIFMIVRKSFSTENAWSRARRFPLPDGPGQVKLPVRQVDLDRFFFFISYKQIEEFQNSWSRASDGFEKRRALMKMCTWAGFHNSIGSIARNGHRAMVFGSDVTHQICIVEHLGNPFFRSL